MPFSIKVLIKTAKGVVPVDQDKLPHLPVPGTVLAVKHPVSKEYGTVVVDSVRRRGKMLVVNASPSKEHSTENVW